MIQLTEISFTPADPRHRASGVIGAVRVTVNRAIILDGLTVTQSERGWPSIEFPELPQGPGLDHRFVRQLNERTRRVISHALIVELRKRGLVP